MNGVKAAWLIIGFGIGYILRLNINSEGQDNKAYFMSGAQLACIQMQCEVEKGKDPTINDILKFANNVYDTRDYMKMRELMNRGWFPPIKKF